jgi:hypothetical protein
MYFTCFSKPLKRALVSSILVSSIRLLSWAAVFSNRLPHCSSILTS